MLHQNGQTFTIVIFLKNTRTLMHATDSIMQQLQ